MTFHLGKILQKFYFLKKLDIKKILFLTNFLKSKLLYKYIQDRFKLVVHLSFFPPSTEVEPLGYLLQSPATKQGASRLCLETTGAAGAGAPRTGVTQRFCSGCSPGQHVDAKLNQLSQQLNRFNYNTQISCSQTSSCLRITWGILLKNTRFYLDY